MIITTPSEGLTWHHFGLELNQPAKRSGLKAPDPLQGKVAVQQPRALRLTAESASKDAELAQFIAAEEGLADYFLLQLGCSFEPAESEPFVAAKVSVALRRADGLLDPLPVAHSMKPRKLMDEVEVTKTVNVKGNVKFFDTGVESGGEESAKRKLHEWYLVAFNEGGSDPAWTFRRQPGREIIGSEWLSLIIRAPAKVVTAGAIRLDVTAERKRWGILTYQVPHRDAQALDFTLE